MTQGTITRPRVTDNGRGAVIVTLEGRQIRLWTYQAHESRRKKMMYAREFIEGWIEGNQRSLRKTFLPSH